MSHLFPHSLRLHTDDHKLVVAVAPALAAELDAGGGVLVVATPSHGRSLVEEIERLARCDVGRARSEGRLQVLDVSDLLARLMPGAWPVREHFFRLAGTTLDSVTGTDRPPRVYDETIDVLVQSGRPDVGIEVERLWNELMAQRAFSRECSCVLFAFPEEADHRVFLSLCREHDDVHPVAEFPGLADDRALRLEVAVLEQKALALESAIGARQAALAELADCRRELAHRGPGAENAEKIAHDINNQLMAIEAFAEILLDTPGCSDVQRETIGRILQAATRTRALSNASAETGAPPAPVGSAPVAILVVDDDVTILHSVARRLRSQGYSVLEAGDVESALRLAGDQAIDLLITDVLLHDGNGLDLALALREGRPRMAVLFASGLADAVSAKAIAAGMRAGYLGKPFALSNLARAIAPLLPI